MGKGTHMDGGRGEARA
jgi:hypothetical protein